MDEREQDATTVRLDEPAGIPAKGSEDNITVRTTRRQELIDELAQEPEISIQPPGDDAAGSANRAAYEEELRRRETSDPGS